MKGRRQDKRGRSKHAPFIRLEHNVFDHPAYTALSPFAKEVLVFLARQYKGPFGYRVMASVRFIERGVNQSGSRVEKSIRELAEAGFIVAEQNGCMGSSGRGTGTIWRLTFLAAESIGATHDYREIWNEREGPKNLESRPARQDKGCPATQDKGNSSEAAGVLRGRTRKAQKSPVPVLRGRTTLKTLPWGAPQPSPFTGAIEAPINGEEVETRDHDHDPGKIRRAVPDLTTISAGLGLCPLLGEAA